MRRPPHPVRDTAAAPRAAAGEPALDEHAGRTGRPDHRRVRALARRAHTALGAPAPGRRWVALTVAAAMLLGAGVTAAVLWAQALRPVTIDADGHVTSTTTRARTVGAVLEQADISVRPGDVVVPAAHEPVPAQDPIVVRRTHKVRFNLDGRTVTRTTTAASVGELLAEMGVRKAHASSTSRSLLREQPDLQVATFKTVTWIIDGEAHQVTTNAVTVGELIDEQQVSVSVDDRVEPPASDTLQNGASVRVDHLLTREVSRTKAVKPGTRTVKDPDAAAGTRRLLRKGVPGERTTVWQVQTLAGQEVARRKISSTVTTEPVDETWAVGTRKPAPSVRAKTSPVPASGARAIGKAMAAERGWTGEQWACLDQLWQRESGWKVSADNPSSSAYGIPQALPGSKMASAGADWRTNAATQIRWGLNYIAGRYTSPCGAWASSNTRGWY